MATRGKKAGGLKGGLVSLLTLTLLAAGVFAWARVNNIHSLPDAYDYFKSWSNHYQKCQKVGANDKTIVDPSWNCDESGRLPTNNGGSTTSSTPPGGSGTTTNPQQPGGGTPPTNGADLTKSKEAYLKTLDAIKVAPPETVSYNRAEWKHWSGEPCNTRVNVLVRDGKGVKVTKASTYCTINNGTWLSPYDNKTYTDSRLLDIDHVVPLSYAAQHGGQAWSPAKKEAFANDMTQLIAVSATENRGKGDKGPSEYMPPERGYQCSYAKIWMNTTTKYGVSITDKDKAALKDALQKC